MVRVLSDKLPAPVGGEGGDNIPVVEVVEVVEDSQGPGHLHHLEAGLAQYEVSDSEAGSSSSFEVLLPDFSSLGLSDVKLADTSCSVREKRSPTPEDVPRNIDNR